MVHPQEDFRRRNALLRSLPLPLGLQLRIFIGRGGELINANCGSCHGVSRITSAAPKSRDDWQTTVDRMMSKGIDMKPDEEETVLNYLVKYFGEEVKVNTASARGSSGTARNHNRRSRRHCLSSGRDAVQIVCRSWQGLRPGYQEVGAAEGSFGVLAVEPGRQKAGRSYRFNSSHRQTRFFRPECGRTGELSRLDAGRLRLLSGYLLSYRDRYGF